MKVRSADLYRLIEESWDKLHNEHGESFKSMNQNFFDKLATYIQKDSMNKYKLKGATLYKQYFLKIKDDTHEKGFISTSYWGPIDNIIIAEHENDILAVQTSNKLSTIWGKLKTGQ